MRKTGLYGSNSDVNVEWPTANDLMQMAKNIPTGIRDLKYCKSTYLSGRFFGAFQVILSNGMTSPVFNAADTNVKDIQSFNIQNYSLVKKINGTKQAGSNYLRCLIFCKKNSTEIAKIETDAGVSYGTESLLDDSEEIIGIYGYKN